MLTGHRLRRAATIGCLTVAVLAAISTTANAPTARADDAALAGWLTKAFEPIEKIHTAENSLIPILAPDPQGGDKPLSDVQVLKEPCDQLRDGQRALQATLPSPNPDLTAEIQQAVDSIDTAVDNCSMVIATDVTDRKKARAAIKAPLYDAEAHLASADIILSKLATPR